jgi:hypothetical protein
MNGQMESITPTDLAVCSCGLVMLLREMQSRLPSRIYTNGAYPSASLAVFSDAPSSIPHISAEFLCFTSKSVEV